MHAKNQISLTHKTLYGIMSLAVFLAAFGAGNLPPARAQGTTAKMPMDAVVSLSADKAFFGAAEQVTLHVTITNPNADPIGVLRWFTPAEGVEEPLFTITRDGEPVAYLGMLVKRAAPTEQDYITLAAGESLSRAVNLSDYYDLSVSGNYAVRYDVASAELYAKADNNAGRLASNTLNLFIDGRAARAPQAIPALIVSGTNAFNGCSSSRRTDLINARNAASTYAMDAVAYFSSNKQGEGYTTWFGVYDLSRYNTVSSHFSAVSSAVDTANPMNFDCGCPAYPDPSGIYAYVYPNSPYNIYLCGAFWDAPMTGTDSKAGTLIHEITHFTVVAGTDDYVYGQTGARALAISNPAQAIMNADSHEYFAENTPPIVEYSYNIISPLQSNPAYAGSYNNPSKIVVEVKKPENGLAKDKHTVAIGGKPANIVTLYEDSAKYVLEVNTPIQSTNGLYDLTVSAVTSTGTVTDTEMAAVSYAEANHVDVELVIDGTGSMSGSKIDAAKNAAKQFVDFMRINDMIGVVSFNTSATTNFPLTIINPPSSGDTKTQAKAAIDAITATNFTSIGAGLQRAQEQLTTLGQADHPWAIILLSDGWENTPPHVADVLPGIVSSKTVVYTIGLGSGADEAQLMDIASQTGGTYNFAPGPEQLAAIYNTIVGEVTGQQTLLSETGTAQGGRVDKKSVVVDSTISEATFSISWSNSAETITLQLKKPDGTIIDDATALSDPNIVYSSGATFAYYRVKTPTLVPGVWEMQIIAGWFPSPSVNKAGNEVAGEPYLARVTAIATLTIETYFNQSSYSIGEPVGIIISLSDSQPIRGANVTVSVQSPSQAAALIRDSEWIELNGDTIPDPEIAAATKAASVQATTTLTLYDDGAHGDGAANDGFYANQFFGTTTAGTYTFNVAASGNTSAGDAFIRQDSKMINVGQGGSIFADVPTTYWARDWIERLYLDGVTNGCSTSPLLYCPDNNVTRAEMAKFLLKASHGSGYTPPAVGTSTGFADVPISHWAAGWIKQLGVEGITNGCGGGSYCPDSNVTRAEMAKFLLKASHGSGYTPPAVGTSTGFTDVPTSYWAAAWIKQLAAEGITSGCGGGNYCPDASVTRAEMAKFLVKTFNLP